MTFEQDKAAEEEEVAEAPKSFWKAPLFWTTIIILLILAAFFIGFKFFGKTAYPTLEYNGFQFYRIEDMWYTQLKFGDKLVTVPLRFNPLEVEDITIHGRLSEGFNRRDIYLTFDPRNTTESNFTILALGAAELSLSLTKAMGINTIASCTSDVTAICAKRPIIDCNAKNRSVIFITDVGAPEILLYGDCVVLKGYNMNLLRSIDRFLYQWYGIMND